MPPSRAYALQQIEEQTAYIKSCEVYPMRGSDHSIWWDKQNIKDAKKLLAEMKAWALILPVEGTCETNQ